MRRPHKGRVGRFMCSLHSSTVKIGALARDLEQVIGLL